jgi:hypothetical protein
VLVRQYEQRDECQELSNETNHSEEGYCFGVTLRPGQVITGPKEPYELGEKHRGGQQRKEIIALCGNLNAHRWRQGSHQCRQQDEPTGHTYDCPGPMTAQHVSTNGIAPLVALKRSFPSREAI